MNILVATYLIAAACPAPVTKNLTKFEWNEFDTKQIEVAQRGCEKYFKDTSVCLKQFTKIGEFDYRALCGAKE